MRTRFILHIASQPYILQDEDLQNWDEVKCSLKRVDLNGVTRAFSSEFVFVNTAYDKLIDLYLSDGINADATIEVQTLTDTWEWESRFSAPLDFSTILIENNTISLNSIDNSLAAIIKANKGVKYELEIGTDIQTSGNMLFCRLPMMESATYAFTQGESFDDKPDIIVEFSDTVNPWLGLIADEICVNGAVDYQKDQEDTSSSYILEAVTDIDVVAEWDFKWLRNYPGWVTLSMRVMRNNALLPIATAYSQPGDGTIGTVLAQPHGNSYTFDGNLTSATYLPSVSTMTGDKTMHWAKINGIVWYVAQTTQNDYGWKNSGKSEEEYWSDSKKSSYTLNLKKGDKVVIKAESMGGTLPPKARFVSTILKFSWNAIGKAVSIPVLEPSVVGKVLLGKMCEGYPYRVNVELSDYDYRVARTRLMAAESARGFDKARLYSSFNDFCEWMSTVFGYVYTVGEPFTPPFVGVQTAGMVLDTIKGEASDSFYNGSYNANVVYVKNQNRFFYRVGETYYKFWETHEDYNKNGVPRTDMLFDLPIWSNGLFKFEAGNPSPIETQYTASDIGKTLQTLRFLHRSELFDTTSVKVFKDVTNVKYSVEGSEIYSQVIIGYNKQDYDSVNGRDEFNFSNTYTTGCKVSDRKLSLVSPYRADCYGIEFAVQKRGEDTTDTDSDTDVFFVLCSTTSGLLAPDRTAEIEGGISNKLFNGAFSPMACIKANKGYIGMQGNGLTLTFASAEGNSDIVIDGVGMTDSFTLDNPIAGVGRIEFLTGDVEMPLNHNGLVKIEDNGITYSGFLLEADFNYSRNASVTYKLIEKEVSL